MWGVAIGYIVGGMVNVGIIMLFMIAREERQTKKAKANI